MESRSVMDRLKVYKRKINYIVEKLSDLPKNLDDPYLFDALLYRLHTSIEAVMDIIAMLVKDLGAEVGDDYTNIEKIRELGYIDISLEEKLKKLNGLRNVIVHRYNKIDRDAIVEELDVILGSIFKFLEIVENVLRKIFR